MEKSKDQTSTINPIVREAILKLWEKTAEARRVCDERQKPFVDSFNKRKEELQLKFNKESEQKLLQENIDIISEECWEQIKSFGEERDIVIDAAEEEYCKIIEEEYRKIIENNKSVS